MKSVKAFVAGSGIGAFSEPSVVGRLLSMASQCTRSNTPVSVAYIGTATYDLPEQQEKQTRLLRERGCEVQPIRVADPEKAQLSSGELDFLRNAHVVLVSGGNTLYAVRRWEETGLATELKACAERQAILAGGSAGAICWFTSGHSDSADPTTYMMPMVMKACGKAKEPSEEEEAEAKKWFYIRVHGLNILPGMMCPHYDQTGSNGILRAEDFAKMMKRHPTERGVALDHWAALILNGDGTYEVFPVPGKTSGASSKAPSVYLSDVVDGTLTTVEAKSKGEVEAILRPPSGPVIPDPFECFYAMSNATPSSGKLVAR